MAKKATNEPEAQADGKPTSKMGAVREALTKLGKDAKPAEIIDLVRREFNLDLDAKTASVYKSQINKGKGGKRRARATAPTTTASKSSGDPVALVVAVKGLADQAGGMGNLKKLVDAMS